MQISSISAFTLALTMTLAVAGCDEEQPTVVPQVRAIKTYTVTEVASGQTRNSPDRYMQRPPRP
jgi:hypothetical protein